MPQGPWTKYATADEGPWTKYQNPSASTIAPTLLESRQEASKQELDANAPQSTMLSRAREAAIGVLQPFDLHNVPGLVDSLGGAFRDALTGKGTAKAQEAVKSMLNAPVQPVKDFASGIVEGDYDKAAGGAGGMLSQTVPVVASGVEAAGRIRPKVMKTAAGGSPPVELYRQGLKRGVPINTDVADVRATAETGLQHSIPISEEGAAKLQALITDAETKVQAHAAAAAQRGVTLDKFKVASRLNDTAKRFGNQVNPEADLQAVSDVGNEFLRNQPDQIPADAAQSLKQGTTRALGDKAYGEIKTASVEAQKALARGIREELAAQVPEIADLTAQQAKLIDLQGALEKAVNKQMNGQPSVFREAVMGAAVKGMTGSNPLAVAAGVLRHVWGDPMFKSKLAIAINQAQQNNPAKWGPPSMKTSIARTDALLSSLTPATDSSGQ